MKKLFFLILVTFSALSSAAELDTKIPFTKDSGKYWQYISDRTMGGISQGQAVLEQEGEMFFARLSGNVSTANNGGFIQLRTNLSFFDFKSLIPFTLTIEFDFSARTDIVFILSFIL